MLIRLLQSFASVTLNTAAQPPDTVPPAAWAGAAGRKGIERVWPQSHLTIFARVRVVFAFSLLVVLTSWDV